MMEDTRIIPFCSLSEDGCCGLHPCTLYETIPYNTTTVAVLVVDALETHELT